MTCGIKFIPQVSMRRNKVWATLLGFMSCPTEKALFLHPRGVDLVLSLSLGDVRLSGSCSCLGLLCRLSAARANRFLLLISRRRSLGDGLISLDFLATTILFAAAASPTMPTVVVALPPMSTTMSAATTTATPTPAAAHGMCNSIRGCLVL